MGKEKTVKTSTRRRETPMKKRGVEAYEKKVRGIKKWHGHLTKCREKEVINPNNKLSVKRKELKPVDFYVDQVKKPSK